jgi:uncharacterized MAPEG superfamily protein
MTGVTALIYFVLWTLLLVGIVLLYRTGLVFTGKTPANSWLRGTTNPSDPGFIVRASHAHQNCLESLPLFAAVVLSASVLGKQAVVDALAVWVLYARLAQSITHLIGVNHWLVMIRATFFTIQLALLAYMAWGLLGAGA